LRRTIRALNLVSQWLRRPAIAHIVAQGCKPIGPTARSVVRLSVMSNSDKYIQALSFKWLTPLYDPILKWGMREDVFKRRLIQQARIKPGMLVLDLGCGTGMLTILPGMIRNAGFERVTESAQFDTIIGGLSLFQAKK
jgi:hypothetical protein